ncbi:hypothetical protein ACFQ6Q_00055 [Streptomyces sp. NPDC056437]|uniref:hypothetical protein n=1 Tax=Streptomyces sp. NPDC056437 TaxID=3345816 RepID=UPI0036923A52
MATDEQKQEQAARELLIQQRRQVDAVQAAALKEPYTPAGWEPWRTAAAELDAAITEHAARFDVGRLGLSQDVLSRAKALTPAQ